MSEPIPACISIGGRLRRKLVTGLCEAIQIDGLSLEWGDAVFQPQTAEDLLNACNEEHGVRELWLCDDQANWGRMPSLEEFLMKEAKLPFDLRSDGKLGIDPDLILHRPGHKLVQFSTTASGTPVVSADLLAPVVKALVKAASAKSQRECQSGSQLALQRMRAILPPAIAPLPPFEIS